MQACTNSYETANIGIHAQTFTLAGVAPNAAIAASTRLSVLGKVRLIRSGDGQEGSSPAPAESKQSRRKCDLLVIITRCKGFDSLAIIFVQNVLRVTAAVDAKLPQRVLHLHQQRRHLAGLAAHVRATTPSIHRRTEYTSGD